jgi:hypothetical protein
LDAAISAGLSEMGSMPSCQLPIRLDLPQN